MEERDAAWGSLSTVEGQDNRIEILMGCNANYMPRRYLLNSDDVDDVENLIQQNGMLR